MLIDGGKMSKSLGNTYTISDLVAKGYSPVVFRYFCLNVQYRQKINFTWEAMDAAKAAYNKLCAQLVSHKNSPARTEKSILDDFHNKFEEAINDDLNIPLAIGVLWTMLKLPKSCDVYKLALDFDRVFALDFDKVKEEKKEIVIPDNVRQLAETRLQARKAKNWAESDRLREELSALGYSVKDTADGYELSEK